MGRHGMGKLLPALVLVSLWTADAGASGGANGYFRIGDARLELRHSLAVIEDSSGTQQDVRTLVFFSAIPLDATRIAAAFDPMDAVREQVRDADGGYVRLCIDADGGECGLFFSPEGFNTSGYGELKVDALDARRAAGRFLLAKPEDFMGKSYDFDLKFDTAVTPPPGTPLTAGGGEPGAAYNAYLAALAAGDVAALRAMAGETGRWRLDQDEPTALKEALKSLRDGQPLQAEIARGWLDGDQAILWVSGIDRDQIHRAGRVLMKKTARGWRYEESDLDSVDE